MKGMDLPQRAQRGFWGWRGYTPVVTGSMRNRVNPQGIEAVRGACDGADGQMQKKRNTEGTEIGSTGGTEEHRAQNREDTPSELGQDSTPMAIERVRKLLRI